MSILNFSVFAVYTSACVKQNAFACCIYHVAAGKTFFESSSIPYYPINAISCKVFTWKLDVTDCLPRISRHQITLCKSSWCVHVMPVGRRPANTCFCGLFGPRFCNLEIKGITNLFVMLCWNESYLSKRCFEALLTWIKRNDWTNDNEVVEQ